MFETINRDHTHAIKWERYRAKNLLPMWVADMDLAAPEAITRALTERVAHPVYGYSHPWTSLNESVVNWCQQRYGWSIDSQWLVWMPGVVPSFNLAVDLFGRHGRVIVQTPNYPPMLDAPGKQGCEIVPLPVTWQDDHWQWDWQLLAQELSHPDCHLFILCNPMNPQGAVLERSELEKLGELCQQHDVLLCSDEIHCDLILDGTKHTPSASLDSLADRCVTLMAASKTFNVAGLGCSFAIIPDAKLRQRWQRRMSDLIPYPNFLGMKATETAFAECADWHQALLTHLKTNRDYLADSLQSFPGMVYRPQPATFLAWIDSTVPGQPLDQLFIEAGIMPSEGKYFGSPDSVRLNFGTGFDLIQQAVEQLRTHARQNR
ncbi:MalY/PatB family protein [Reinekea blandensis]|uniref:cysteine-S-conjugate beta-lyase n=1 Tax=Reinekea blandensis MED297 TaxID=314283 RepID=A4BBN6_9GAMM|nr:PatB family C-S lyase [Reinekea blandensis]EAR10371.1 putative aminotransferase [Reinekea sp. MED297] [Reinekea blandensis MED297]